MKSLLLRRIFRLSALFFIFFNLPKCFPAESFFSLSHTATFAGKTEHKISTGTPVIDVFVLLKSSSELPEFQPEPYSFAFTLKPVSGITVTGGAICLTGLPERTCNPVPCISEPSYTPIIPFNGSLIRRGTSKETGNIALEISQKGWKVAGEANPGKQLDEPAWILVSRSVSPPRRAGTGLSCSLFAGAHRIEPDPSDSWFLSEPYRPASVLIMPAMEVALANDSITASCTGFLNGGKCRAPAGMLRGDFSVSLTHFALSGGASMADQDFVSLNGKTVPIIRRLFLLPSATFPLSFSRITTVCIRCIAINDIVRQEKYWQENETSSQYGTKCCLANPYLELCLEVMKKHEELCLSGSLNIGPFRCFPVQFETSAKSTITESKNGEKQPVDSRLTAGTAWLITKNLQTSIEGAIERASPDRAPIRSGSAKFSAIMHTKHSVWNLRAGLSATDDGTPLSGEISLGTVFR